MAKRPRLGILAMRKFGFPAVSGGHWPVEIPDVQSWAPNLSRKYRSSDDKARYSKTLLMWGINGN
jgi:hypothetical protein